VLVGGRATLEDAYAYAKFARVALGTNDVDFRARPHSDEEEQFLGAHVAGTGIGVSYDDLERATSVLLVGLEPEEESPIVFLRLRKAVRKNRLVVHAVAPFATRGLEKLSGRLVPAAPGTEPEVLDALAARDARVADAADALRTAGSVILVGERLASVPGALSAAVALAESTGSRLAWVPRRAGERGALEAGAVPSLLTGGRPVADASARADIAAVWGVESLPAQPGRSTAQMLEAVHTGEVRALLVGGVDPDDLPDPTAALAAVDAADFVVSLEMRASAVTERADVVLPIAPAVEKSGTFVDWEGRERSFVEALRGTNGLPDVRVLHVLAAEMGVDLKLPHVAAAKAEIADIDAWDGERVTLARHEPTEPVIPAEGEAVLATWHLLLDAGRLQDGEPFLAGTARPAHARMSPGTAGSIDATDGSLVTVATERGSVTVPLVVTEMPDRVVWLPTNSEGCAVRRDLGADAGSVVRIAVASGSLAEPVASVQGGAR
jgi:NADH-quinone oxidoreductase subunit G